jgi:predicted secreted protein
MESRSEAVQNVTVFRFRCPKCHEPNSGVLITASVVLTVQEAIKIIRDKHPSCILAEIEVTDIHGNTFGTLTKT